MNAEGETSPLPVAGIVVLITTPLEAGGVWDSGILHYNGASTIDYQIASNVPGTYSVT